MKEAIAILTGGGPAPGMNTVVGSVAKTFLAKGYRVIGLHYGYSGLFNPSPRYEDLTFTQADYIFTAKTTSIGAIGTVMQVTDLSGLMEKLGLKDGEAIENTMVTRAVESAQKRVEAHHFEIRKTLLDYDNVMNQQREVIYTLRRDMMVEEDLEPVLSEFRNDILDDAYTPLEQADTDTAIELRKALQARLADVFNLGRVLAADAPVPDRAGCEECIHQIFQQLREEAGPLYQDILRYFLLEELDRTWKEHLRNMDALRDGIGLRGYGQKDPKLEYKREGFEMFQSMLFQIREGVFRALTRVHVQPAEPAPAEDAVEEGNAPAEAPQQEAPKAKPTLSLRHKENDDLAYSGSQTTDAGNQPAKAKPRVGRNDPCPCGSGKKYKKCCGMGKV